MTTDRLQSQLAFIREVDRLKCIFRQTILMDRSRRENDAEHSWHLALMAVVLAEHAREPVDVGRVVLDTRPEHQIAPGVIHFAVLATLAEVSAARAVGAPVVPASITLNLLARPPPEDSKAGAPLSSRGAD